MTGWKDYFTPDELEALTSMVSDWIGDGFATPPYTDAQYAIFEKLGLNRAEAPGWIYDTRRPQPTR
jgi:hypothetical protein